MFKEASNKKARWFLSENSIRKSKLEDLERLARFLDCLPFLPRESKSRPGFISRGYKRTLIKNVVKACCKNKEIWEIQL